MEKGVVYTTYFGKVNRLPKGIVPIAISLYQPANCSDIKKYPALAPTKKILSDWKHNEDEERYIRDFKRQILDILDPGQVYNNLAELVGEGKDIALVCYEQSGRFCHRHFVAKWLKEAGFPVGGELQF